METQKQNNSSSHSTKYQRHTELRHLDANDIFQLGLILDDNECWKKLMEIIPKKLDAQASSADGQLDWSKAIELGGRKYNNDHMRLIEQATKRSSDRARLYSQTLIDEWSTSGRKHERPTVGVLLQLLVEAELFRAADYVAIEFLGEPPPERPLNGPAARIEISLPSELFSDIKDMVNDSNYYPETEVLNANANSISNSTDTNNKDYYVKYQSTDKDLIINDNVAPPKPPPRQGRSARLSQQQIGSPQTKLETIEEVSNKNGFYNQKQQMSAALSESSNEQNNSNNSKSTSPILSTANIPKLSDLFITQQSSHNNRDAVTNNIDPSFENKNSRISSNIIESAQISEAIIPNLSLLENLTSSERESLSSSGSTIVSTANVNSSNVLPVISALNLNGEKDNLSDRMSDELDSSSDSDNSNQNDDAADDEDAEMPNATNTTIENDDNEEQDEDNSNSLPNLSIFGERSSNNDSSLTNVTGTSGENSFEISTNDSSSASNDDNVPCLSALQQ